MRGFPRKMRQTKQNNSDIKMEDGSGSDSEDGSGMKLPKDREKTTNNAPEEDTPESVVDKQDQQNTNNAQETIEVQFNDKKDPWMKIPMGMKQCNDPCKIIAERKNRQFVL